MNVTSGFEILYYVFQHSNWGLTLSAKFIKNWDRKDKVSLFERISEKVHRKPPLRERLSNSVYRLNVIQTKLEQLTRKMEQKDRDLFNRCTEALSNGDEERAKIYANECTEIRKVIRVLLRSQLAIEQVTLRLETVREFGDVLGEMGPVASVVHSLKGQLAGILPEVSYELGVIGDTLNGFIVEAGEATGLSWDVEASSEEAQKILQAATAVAEHKIKESLPELPLPTTSVSHEKSSINP